MDSIADVGVFLGEQVNIPCQPPLGKPSPRLLWLKDENEFSDPRIDQSDWTLTILNARSEDTGKYTCVAMGVKNRTASAQLTVHSKYICFSKMVWSTILTIYAS